MPKKVQETKTKPRAIKPRKARKQKARRTVRSLSWAELLAPPKPRRKRAKRAKKAKAIWVWDEPAKPKPLSAGAKAALDLVAQHYAGGVKRSETPTVRFTLAEVLTHEMPLPAELNRRGALALRAEFRSPELNRAFGVNGDFTVTGFGTESGELVVHTA